MKAILLAALFTLAGTSFAENDKPRTTESKAPPAATLGFLETREHFVEIKAGEKGPYTVRAKNGKVLAESLSAERLQAQFPKLHQIVRGVAWNSDARVP